MPMKRGFFEFWRLPAKIWSAIQALVSNKPRDAEPRAPGAQQGSGRAQVGSIADDDDKKELPPFRPAQPPPSMGWADTESYMPRPQRNNALLDSAIIQPASEFPLNPQTGGGEDLQARFQKVQRLAQELNSSVDELRDAMKASPGGRDWIGHNQGPNLEPEPAPVPVEDLTAVDNFLLGLLKERGPTPTDPKTLIEQADKALQLSQQIRDGLTALGIETAKLGAREVAKKLTAPLWAEVAQRIVNLYHAVIDWVSPFL
jgi:hypothetical protein